MRIKRIVGLVLTILGVFFIVNSFTGITGYAISSASSASVAYFVAVIILAVGVVLIYADAYESYCLRTERLKGILGSRYDKLTEEERDDYNKSLRRHEKKGNEKGKLEVKVLPVIKTERFERAIKNHDIHSINRAIEKLTKGGGKREKLSHLDGFSIRTSKKGRIIYDVKDGEYVLKDYLPDHKYGKGKY